MSADLTFIAICGATFLLAGFVKGLIGLGLPTVSLAILSVIYGLPLAIPLMVIPSAVTNFWQGVVGGNLTVLLRRFWPLLLGLILGTVAGYLLLHKTHPMAMTAALGLVLCIYALAGLFGFLLWPRGGREAVVGPTVGTITGVLTGATGSMVMPQVAYFQSRGLTPDALVQMMGIAFTTATVVLGLLAADQGMYDQAVLEASTISLIPAILGMLLGQSLRKRISEKLFKRCLMVGLLAIGIHLLWKGISGL